MAWKHWSAQNVSSLEIQVNEMALVSGRCLYWGLWEPSRGLDGKEGQASPLGPLPVPLKFGVRSPHCGAFHPVQSIC